ncbi:MAG TPA: hypothetical protein VK211_12615 [Kamptonema sp.]|nr:hypothetical protein [Kamptonema sp.]
MPNLPKPTSTPSLQILCIDSSKFDNRDRPAADIYLQLVKKHHCPKSTGGIAPTLIILIAIAIRIPICLMGNLIS